MQMKPADRVKQDLLSIIQSLLEDRNGSLKNPQTDFTRTQKISFEQTMIFPMVIGTDNAADELLDFFGEKKMPFPSAMIQRRSQVKLEAFQNLFYRFSRRVPITNTCLNYQIAACDGTRLNLAYHPADTETFTQSIKDRKGINQMHMNCLYDTLNDIYLDIELQGIHQIDEQKAFCILLDRNAHPDPVLPKRIYVADRGFAGYNVFAHAIHNQQLFMIRVSETFARDICTGREHWLEDPCVDEKIIVHVGRRNTKANRLLENYHFIPSARNYDYIEPLSDDVEQLELRVLKFPISEDSFEYIVTNLPSYAFSMLSIKTLYSLRWNEEISFRYLKYAGTMVSLHSWKKELILQEIYAKLTAYNFSAFVAAVVNVRQKKTEKYTYVLNHTQVQKFCRKFLQGNVQDVEALITKYFVPVRPGRSFPRKLRRQSADTFTYR